MMQITISIDTLKGQLLPPFAPVREKNIAFNYDPTTNIGQCPVCNAKAAHVSYWEDSRGSHINNIKCSNCNSTFNALLSL